MTSYARSERAGISAAFAALGPDSPTLCGDWSTRDLAVHLIVREARPDAAPGILIPQLAGYTAKVSRDLASSPWPELVARIESGPPRWSAFRLGAIDELANTAEFFVHHEDVLRGADPTARRTLDEGMENALWGVLGRMGRVLLRDSPVGVDIQCPGKSERPLTKAGQGAGRVTLVGAPSEVLLRTFGRGLDNTRLVDVEIRGADDDVAAFTAFSPGF